MTKQFEETINLDVFDIFVPDISESIMKKLRDKFERRCYKSSYIVKIDSIIQRSSWTSGPSMSDGSGSVSVLFNAQIDIVEPGSVIVNSKIITDKSVNHICESENIVITLKSSTATRRFATGMMIPTQIMKVSYSKGRDKMTAEGMPFVVQREAIIYRIDASKPMDPIVSASIPDLLKTAHETAFKLQEQNATMVKFFKDMLYPYKTVVVKPKQPRARVDDIIAMATNKVEGNFYLLRHPNIDKTTSAVYVFEPEFMDDFVKGKIAKSTMLNPDDFKMKELSDETLDVAIVRILDEHIKFMQIIIDMCNVYHSEEIRGEHKPLWNFYEKYKQ